MAKGTLLIRHVPALNEIIILKVYGFAQSEATEENKEDLACALYHVEVDNLERKQALLAGLLEPYHIKETSYYICNERLVVELLKSWNQNTESSVKQETKAVIPDGTYYLNRKVKSFGEISGVMEIKDGKYIVKKGSTCAPFSSKYKNDTIVKLRAKYVDTYNKIKVDIECPSVSGAAVLLIGNSANGNAEWKDANGKTIGEIFSIV